jgi:alpha-mannosidase
MSGIPGRREGVPDDVAGLQVPRYRGAGYLSIPQRQARLTERLAEVALWRDREFIDIGDWTFDGAPLSSGAAWPDRHGVRALAAIRVRVPDEWPLDEARLHLRLGGEGLLRISSLDFGGEHHDHYGLDPYHDRFPPRSRSVCLDVQIVARFPFGEPNRTPALELARVVWQDRAVDEFARQLTLVLEAVGVLDDEAADALLSCAERALARVDWPSGTADYLARSAGTRPMQDIWEMPDSLDPAPPGLSESERESVASASRQLATDLAAMRESYPPRGELLMSGHAHLDLAWLWPLAETRRKALRTGWTAVSMMAAYPEFTFNQSSAQWYAFVEQDDPELLQRITKAVTAGQWEPVGGMWVEPDCNLPCGESQVRQLLYGQQLFQRMFGSTPRVGWLPDSFGLSPVLPQLFASAGITGLFAQKVNGADVNWFPYDLYWWQGLDGSRVLVHAFENPDGHYDAMLGPEAMVRTWQNFRSKNVHRQSLLTVGYGDGGGGPTVEMVEKSRLLAGYPALPRAEFGRVDELFDRLLAAAADADLPVWNGELYLEFHRGTYTTQGRLKRLHRRAERDLVAAEVLGVLRALAGDEVVGEGQAQLTAAWQTLLLNQFHDILPGSSIREVNAEAEEQLTEVVATAAHSMDDHLQGLRTLMGGGGDRQDGVLLVNPDLSVRPVRAFLDRQPAGAQPVEGGAVVATAQVIEGLEARIVTELAPPPGLSASSSHLENDFVRVQLDDTGALTSVYDKSAGREVLSGRGNQIWAYVDKPRLYDAWEIDMSYVAAGQDLGKAESVEQTESGPHRAAIRVTRRFRASTIVQDVRLWANSPRIDFHTTIDWHDRHWLVKARFPLAIHAEQATFETAFGVIRRPTHRNTSWDAAKFEVPGHRFADLSEAGYGAALLNDGRYGYHALGSELGLSLLRSPVYPDPLADEGQHEFTYALLPHAGTWYEAGVLAEAEDLNRPLISATVRAPGPSSWRPLRVGGLSLGLGALKPAEDADGYVLRCYEPHGARGDISLDVPPGWQVAGELDVLERPSGPATPNFTPFQVRTWRLTRSS